MTRFYYGDDDHYWVAPVKLLSIVRGGLQRDIIVQNLLRILKICNDLHTDMIRIFSYWPFKDWRIIFAFPQLVHPSCLPVGVPRKRTFNLQLLKDYDRLLCEFSIKIMIVNVNMVPICVLVYKQLKKYDDFHGRTNSTKIQSRSLLETH